MLISDVSDSISETLSDERKTDNKLMINQQSCQSTNRQKKKLKPGITFEL